MDPVSELPMCVEGFEEMLARIGISVLALFGETDMTVDWRRTKLLYERGLGPNKQLTLKPSLIATIIRGNAKLAGSMKSKRRIWDIPDVRVFWRP